MNRFNSVRRQPPLSFFDKSFSDNPGDALFCSLNEIEPIFLEQESLLNDEFRQTQIIDPRNKQPIIQTLYDYTVIPKPDLFRSAHKSLLTKKEHSNCLSFLQSLKAKQQIFPHQLQCFEETSAKRQSEKNTFLKFLQQYNDANYEKIYAPRLMLLGLYQQFYKYEAKRLMDNHRNGIFQIHTGFPMPRLCGNSEMYGSVSDLEVVSSNETVPVLDTNVDLSKMKTRMETYLETHMNKPREIRRMLANPVQFEISTEALVFLLCAGEYIDIPTEVIVIVMPVADGECTILSTTINDPLPSRNAGVHTTELVVKLCAKTYLEQIENKVSEEIQANGFNAPYSLQPFDTFMESHNKRTSPKIRRSNLVKWNLSLGNDERHISVLTSTNLGYRERNKRGRVCYSLKLEYKSKFGCEIPSKVSLIREWIEQRLFPSDSSTNRHRIDASTFKTVLQENLSTDDIEQQLERHYHVRIPHLLGSLGDFLCLLARVTPGRYILRYNPRFPDKLMLYSESKEVTSKTCVTLHGLLMEEPSDMAFMTLRQLTPIDELLCTAMHDFYKVLPCAFPPWRTAVTNKIIDDRNFILKKVQQKNDLLVAKQNKVLQRRKKVKRLKKAKKAKMKSQQKQAEQEDKQELEDDINHDRLLYGFQPSQRN